MTEIARLKLASTEDLMAELKSRGKFVDNLWTTDDVKSRFDCTDEEAQEVLYEVLTNEYTMEHIWASIERFGDDGTE